ncbi:uncharacterized protein FOMMEDRAFT_165218 [Fomitiporia mediterranea MF3/22]|uniref:uncharacterized protein n=1 Tax=Fomitiporia mediterranea (strain MF3/22) TaxID=694068 RepID=UPI00044080CA|nr:uncharacterized protein FOMMEDRAFT_165218 [Fomitiporia mediterranea MF3/22]EJD06412.1 hypothetical protein FOMMEDRAFT_165218 [Fomitiporia mediterranea MF3/22]
MAKTPFSVVNIDLCLACSGSPLSGSRRPGASLNVHEKTEANSDLPSKLSPDSGEDEVFRTSCCARPICAACLRANSRLARYVPCLACLGGVKVVAGPSNLVTRQSYQGHVNTGVGGNLPGKHMDLDVNLNGALRDGDVFVVGDGDDEVGDESEPHDQDQIDSPPAYGEIASWARDASPKLSSSTPPFPQSLSEDAMRIRGQERIDFDPEIIRQIQKDPTSTSASGKADPHYIRKDDTLRGLALRYKVDGRVLCKLNNLPPSTLSTTPHLLHTRTVLVLPPSAKPVLSIVENGLKLSIDKEREHEIELEKTAKRLQLITKEEDWRIARAYSVLAESSSSSSARFQKDLRSVLKETEKQPEDDTENEKKHMYRNGEKVHSTTGTTTSTLQERALDAYLEDDAWETRERVAGRRPPSEMAHMVGKGVLGRLSGQGVGRNKRLFGA